jgi:hypothetical protein
VRVPWPACVNSWEVSGEFAQALETVHGRQIADRLTVLSRQLASLTSDVQKVAEELDTTVAVLPPHRTHAPTAVTRPQAALPTTAPAMARPRVDTSAHRL